MSDPEKELTEKESLALIATMINKAKDSYHDTGIAVIMWGVVIAFCSLERLAEIHFDYRLPFDVYLLTLVAVIPQIFFTIKEKRERKVKSYDDTFLDYLWLGFGISIFLMIYIINSIFNQWLPTDVMQRLPHEFPFYSFVAPLMLLLYGMPTFVTGAAFRFKPMLWGGIFCWICCIASIYTTVKIDLLLTAFSAVFAWLVPGIIMEQDYRKAKRELKEDNV